MEGGGDDESQQLSDGPHNGLVITPTETHMIANDAGRRNPNVLTLLRCGLCVIGRARC